MLNESIKGTGRIIKMIRAAVPALEPVKAPWNISALYRGHLVYALRRKTETSG